MGLVPDALVELLRKQIGTHCALVWYYPERGYLDLAPSLRPEQVADAKL
jgi:hypothetical protein